MKLLYWLIDRVADWIFEDVCDPDKCDFNCKTCKYCPTELKDLID